MPNSYQVPGKTWGGLISVGKQSLMGNSANFHNYIQNGVSQQEKSRAKLDDEPNKTSENGEFALFKIGQIFEQRDMHKLLRGLGSGWRAQLSRVREPAFF